ncbi:MAG: PilZ domain-containing protein [Oligoflexales bacterium]|nr:PilZ domain-containing protein [Oligoflexales bacterium]
MEKNDDNRGRLKYPKFDRPILKMDGANYEIIDLSISGVKFKGNVNLKLKPSDEYFVEIITMSDQPIQTKARYVRRVGDLFALTFTKHLPEKLIKKEEERIKKKFGDATLD